VQTVDSSTLALEWGSKHSMFKCVVCLSRPTLACDGEGLAQHEGQARAHRAQQRAQQLLRGGAGDALRRSRRRLVGGNAARLERQQQVGRTLPRHCGKR